MNPIESAMAFAVKAHGDQRYGEFPYVKHLQDVCGVLSRFGYLPQEFPELHQAGFLHDVVEDVGVELVVIMRLFGPDVADIVYRVTNEPGENRRERGAKTYPKIAGRLESTVLKLADRIANVENSMVKEPRLIRMYIAEHPSFRKAIWRKSQATDAMWEHLDNLIAQAAERTR